MEYEAHIDNELFKDCLTAIKWVISDKNGLDECKPNLEAIQARLLERIKPEQPKKESSSFDSENCELPF